MNRFKATGFAFVLILLAVMTTLSTLCPAEAAKYGTKLKVGLTAQPPTLDVPMTVS